MSKLYKVVSDFFIRERLIGLCKVDEIVIQGFDCLILCRVGSDFIGVEFERQTLVMRFNLLLSRRLYRESVLAYQIYCSLPFTSEMPRMSYGFQILGDVLAVTVMR
jgi:hypothetical protein